MTVQVGLEENAIKALANNSAALDVYIWLAYRLHSLTGPRAVTWKALKAQFGTSYKELYHGGFKLRSEQHRRLVSCPR